MNYNDLTPEQRKRAAECNTAEELFALAKEEGVEIPDDDLESIAGGRVWGTPNCPQCDSALVAIVEDNLDKDGTRTLKCKRCGYTWVEAEYVRERGY